MWRAGAAARESGQHAMTRARRVHRAVLALVSAALALFPAWMQAQIARTPPSQPADAAGDSRAGSSSPAPRAAEPALQWVAASLPGSCRDVPSTKRDGTGRDHARRSELACHGAMPIFGQPRCPAPSCLIELAPPLTATDTTLTPSSRVRNDIVVSTGRRSRRCADECWRSSPGIQHRYAPTQIYRALEFLQEAGLLHRLATKSTYVVCEHEHAPGETTVFLVCAGCGTVEEAASRGVERGLKGAAAAPGFKARHPVVEVEGECAACQHQ